MAATEVAVAVLVALASGGFLGSIVQGIWQRKKLGADYAEVVARSATSLLQPLATRVEQLQEELQIERGRVRSLARDLDDARDNLNRARRALMLLRDELESARREAADDRRHER